MDIRGQDTSHDHAGAFHPDNANVLQTVGVSSFAAVGPTSIALNLAVTSGQLLSFVVYGGSGSLSMGLNGYANGSVWTQGNPSFGLDGAGTWYPNAGTTATLDLQFQTFVDDGVTAVPEPASLLLLGSGLGLIAARQRRTSRRS